MYLKENGCKNLLNDAALNNALNQKQMSELCDKLVMYVNDDTSQENIEKVCRSVVRLVPCLEREPSSIGGIVSTNYWVLWNFRSNILLYKLFYIQG